jgi:hypothetical protein
MAKGREKHKARQAALSSLGRGVSRRARSACELCGASGRLMVIEIAGGPEVPEEDWAALLCERCQDLVEDRRRHPEGDQRFLESAVWSEVQPAQIAAVRLVRGLAAAEVSWARDCLDSLYLDEALEALI